MTEDEAREIVDELLNMPTEEELVGIIAQLQELIDEQTKRLEWWLHHGQFSETPMLEKMQGTEQTRRTLEKVRALPID